MLVPILRICSNFGYLVMCLFLMNMNVIYGQEQALSGLTIDECLRLAREKEEADDPREASRFLNEIATRYWEKKEYRAAINYYEQSIELNKRVANYNGIAGIQSNLGLIYFDMGDYDSSLENFRQTYQYRKDHHEKVPEISALINMSVVLNKMDRYDDAVDVLEKASSLAREMNDLYQMRSCYGMLSEAYTKAGNTNKAADYFHLYKTVHETLQKESEKKYKADLTEATMQMQLAEAQKRYADLELLYKQRELEEKDRTLEGLDSTNRELLQSKSKTELLIENLKKNEEIADLQRIKVETQLDNERMKIQVLIIGLVLFLIIGVVIGFFYWQNRRYGKRLAQQNLLIKESRDKILEQNAKLEDAFIEIQHKNDDITHGINYAAYIQRAFLTTQKDFLRLLPDSFVFTQPCAIVNGDFFWTVRMHNKTIVACADCTGHGVAGAFMSIIGSHLLTQIVNQGITEPDELLSMLHVAIYHALHKSESGLHNGMDIALYAIDMDKKQLEFAGAKMPLVIIQNGELQKFAGDKQAIGGDYFTSDDDTKKTFTKHTISLEVPTYIYVASDGYQSQISFAEGKKFQSKRLYQLLQEIHLKPMTEQKNILKKVIDDWTKCEQQIDDILVIGVKVDLTDHK